MKIKWLLPFLFLCFASTLLMAQQPVTPLKMSFKNQKIKLADFPYHITQVIDARIDTHYIGFVKNRQFKKIPAITYLSLQEELSQLFERSFPKTKTSKPLILKINHFFIYEHFIKGKEHLVAEANISFFEEKNGNFYKISEVIAHSHKRKRQTMSSTNTLLYNKNMVVCLKTGLEKFLSQSLQTKAPSLISKEQLITNSRYTNTYPVLAHPIDTTVGVFYTFEDFIAQRKQVIRLSHQVTYPKSKNEHVSPTAKLMLTHTTSPKLVNNIWGFSDGKHYYAKNQNKFYQLKQQDSLFIMYAPPPIKNKHTKKMGAAGAITGGLSGLGLGTLIGSIIDKSKSNRQSVLYQLNFTTGSLQSPEMQRWYEQEGQVVFQGSPNIPADTPIAIYHQEEELCRIEANQYYVLTTPPHINELTLSFHPIETVEWQSTKTIYPQSFQTQFYFVQGQSNSRPRITKVPNNKKGAVIHKIENQKILPVCQTDNRIN